MMMTFWLKREGGSNRRGSEEVYDTLSSLVSIRKATKLSGVWKRQDMWHAWERIMALVGRGLEDDNASKNYA